MASSYRKGLVYIQNICAGSIVETLVMSASEARTTIELLMLWQADQRIFFH